jgi:hypothetical protein
MNKTEVYAENVQKILGYNREEKIMDCIYKKDFNCIKENAAFINQNFDDYRIYNLIETEPKIINDLLKAGIRKEHFDYFNIQKFEIFKSFYEAGIPFDVDNAEKYSTCIFDTSYLNYVIKNIDSNYLKKTYHEYTYDHKQTMAKPRLRIKQHLQVALDRFHYNSNDSLIFRLKNYPINLTNFDSVYFKSDKEKEFFTKYYFTHFRK